MRVGIVGLGHRLAYLARIFSLESDRFSVVGYVDLAPAGLPYTQQHGIPVGKQYPTPEAMLAAEKLDLLMVGSPNLMHLGHIKLGLDHGLKVFTEKPVVTSVEDTIELASMLARHDPHDLMVGLNRQTQQTSLYIKHGMWV